MRLFEGTPFDRPPHCERCDRLESECVCPPPEPAKLDPSRHAVKLFTQKRKKGKLVTVVAGLGDAGVDLQPLLTDLKNHCGAGGTLTDGELEIQGDQLKRLEQYLKSQGFRVKVAGRK
ncbi:MAG: translation initiation factor [Planctomycetaceae bacterium]|nr:translation initiation factor [Planctomycetaceae bacterium]